MISLGIDPAATLATSTWVLQRDGEPVAAGTCDSLPDLTGVTRIILESIHAAALASSTGKLGHRSHNTLTPVIFTEGLLSGTFIHAHGFRLATGKEMASTGQSAGKARPVAHGTDKLASGFDQYTPLALGALQHSSAPPPVLYLIPRTAILQQFLGYWPYRKGLKVDAAVLAKLHLTHPAYLKRGSHLSTVDKRDAYLASQYLTPVTTP